MDIQPIVIGTAGHIDHGKSTLVRALTGIDPDRLKEERERGLTIDLGFARLPLPDGRLVGIVDVPGHERFVRNMVAGATGVDLVLLVVAADDGVMPQTREHLDILQLLGVREGLVALTKVDTVDEEMVELATEDVRELVRGTFLEDAPVLPVSAVSGQGMDELRAAIVDAAGRATPRSADGVFRLPVQRAFTLEGFGTVVTGIPVSGEVKVGDTLEVLPGRRRAKVRGIHAYGQATDRGRAGHSVALNLSDTPRESVERGSVVAQPDYFQPVRMVGARLQVLASAPLSVTNRMRVRLHTGTSDPRGEVVLLDRDEIPSGEAGLVQLRLDEPVVCAPGDRFVLRQLSPVVTLGGGVILEESRYRLKRFKDFVLDELAAQEASLDSPPALVESVLARRGLERVPAADLAAAVKRSRAEVEALLAGLAEEHRVASLGGGTWIHVDALERGRSRLRAALTAFFEENPHRTRIDVRDLRAALDLDPALAGALLEAAEAEGELELEAGGRVRPLGPGREVDPAVAELAGRVEEALGTFQPPSAAELASSLGSDEETVQRCLVWLEDEGRTLRIAGDLYFSTAALERAREAVVANCREHGHLEIPALRDALGTSRKFLIPLLEHFDATGVTLRQGAHRVLKAR